MKYCPFCGVGLQDEMKFCPTCGKEYQGAISEEKDNKTSADWEKTEKSVSKENVAPKKKRDFRRLRIGGAIFLALALVVGTWVLFKPSFSENASAISEKSKSVVMIYCYDNFGNVRATGSGFVAYNDSTIITNYHVIDRAVEIKISTEEDFTISVKSVIAYDKNKDIAVLKTEEPTGVKPLAFGDSTSLQKGEEIVAIGSPLGNKNTVSNGLVSGRDYYSAGDMDMLQFSAPISSGSSGGALFDNKGKVVGITSASYTAGQNLNLAIPIEAADELYHGKGKGGERELPLKNVLYAVYNYDNIKYYLESEYVAIEDLIANPQRYDGKTITTTGYILPASASAQTTLVDAFGFVDERAAFEGIKRSETAINAIACVFLENRENETGYAEISGIFSIEKGYIKNGEDISIIDIVGVEGFGLRFTDEDLAKKNISSYMVGEMSVHYFEEY